LSLKDVRALLDLAREYDLAELELERGGERIRLRRDMAAPPLASPPVAAPVTAPPAGAEPVRPERRSDLVTVEAPMVGTFYRAPSPDAEPFVREGDRVKQGQVLCIIEAMKLMNEIESRAAGRVVKILAENGQPVEYGQALLLLEP
jgi:acetyl-CoA carboxylase biotin carboxyl carrier protein